MNDLTKTSLIRVWNGHLRTQVPKEQKIGKLIDIRALKFSFPKLSRHGKHPTRQEMVFRISLPLPASCREKDFGLFSINHCQ